MSQYRQGVYDDADDDPNRVARALIEADPTLVVVADPGNAARYYVAEADHIYRDLSAPDSDEQWKDLQARCAEYVDENSNCQAHTGESWCRRNPTHDRDMVDRYLGHVSTNLGLEICDITALRDVDPNFVRNLILDLARGESQLSSPFLPITVYAAAVWSPYPYGPPVPIPQPPGLGGPMAHHTPQTRVAVFDAGIPREYDRDHPYLTGVADTAFRGVENPYNPPGYMREGAGHGLFIMDIIYRRCARAAPVLMPDVTRKGPGLTISDSTVPMFLNELATRFAKRGKGQLIVNMSFTAQVPGDHPKNTLLARELQHLLEQGLDVLCVAAAGNDTSTELKYPAAYGQDRTDGPALANVVSVGALKTGSNTVAGFSNRGPWVQGWVGGTDVEAAYLPGVYPSEPDPATFPVDPGAEPWARWQGTSFAVPKVVAAIACQAKVGERTLLDVWNSLRSAEHPFVGTTAEAGVILNVP